MVTNKRRIQSPFASDCLNCSLTSCRIGPGIWTDFGMLIVFSGWIKGIGDWLPADQFGGVGLLPHHLVICDDTWLETTMEVAHDCD